MPAIPAEERALLPRAELMRKLVKVVLPPVGLVGAVLGSIIAGIAAPSEAASMGALGSILITAVTGRLNMRVLRETCQATLKTTAMMMFILICAQVFALAFRGLQGEKIVHDLFALLPGGISGRHLVPDADHLHPRLLHRVDRNLLHRGAAVPAGVRGRECRHGVARDLICVNLQTSFLTPPFGWALFFLRGVAPPEVSTGDIYRGIIPFVGMQLLALVLCFCFPGIATWLPRAIGW